MKLSTTQDTAYLKECLAFHVKRRSECYNAGDETGRQYHRKQIKWFEAKLRSPFRSSPIPTPERSQMPAADNAHARYEERLALYRSQLATDEATPEPPKPAGLISRLWNRIRGL